MSTFTNYAATVQTLSVTAMEEASRFGQRVADIDHLLLALTLNQDVSGQVLRSLGVTLDAARQALLEEQTQQLASLGIHGDFPIPGTIVFDKTGGYQWSERALALLQRASKTKGSNAGSAILRELMGESSGLIEALLHRCGTSAEQVVERLDNAENSRSTLENLEAGGNDRSGETGGGDGGLGTSGSGASVGSSEDAASESTNRGAGAEVNAGAGGSAARKSKNTAGEAGGDRLSGRVQAFIPAAPAKVWALLADPSRIPEWEQSVGAVETLPDQGNDPRVSASAAGRTWLASSHTHRPDGKPLKVKPEAARVNVQLSDLQWDPGQERGRLIEWRFSYPDMPKVNSKLVRIELEQAAGGTQLHIFYAWISRNERRQRPISALLMRPLYRLIIWLQMSQISGGISRVFR